MHSTWPGNGGVYYLLWHVGPVQCRPNHGPGVHQPVTERMGNVAPETVRTPVGCFEVAGLGSLHYDVLKKKTIMVLAMPQIVQLRLYM